MSRWTPADLKSRWPGVSATLYNPSAARTAPPVDSTVAADPLIPSAPAGKRQRSKYGAVKTGGYASKREAKRAAELKLLEKAGTIRNLREQVEFELIPKQGKERPVKYRADFVYDEDLSNRSDCLWGAVVEDCKGFRTPVYKLKKRLMLFIHGIVIRET